MLEDRIRKQELMDRHTEFMKGVRQLRPLFSQLNQMPPLTARIAIRFAPGVKSGKELLWLKREAEAFLLNLHNGRRKVELYVAKDNEQILFFDILELEDNYLVKLVGENVEVTLNVEHDN